MRGVRSPIQTPRPRITRTSVLLALMAMLVLAMPMSYRAGTETDHPHAFFQTVIDHITGRPHHHHPHDGHAHAPMPVDATSLSPFAPPGIPLNALRDADQAPLVPPELPVDPDVPSITSLKPVPDQPLVLATVAAALILAAMTIIRRCMLLRVRVPGALTIAPEPPPPRLLSTTAALSLPLCRSRGEHDAWHSHPFAPAHR